MIAGERYAEPPAASPRWLFGDLYRDLWSVPVEVEVLDLASEAGGLEPLFRVGGFQTKGLAIAGADGRSYTFRGAQKDLEEVVPEEFKGSGIELVIQDMPSSALPGGAVIVPPLAAAAEVLHVEPRMVVMPDDRRLGEFRADFAGVVGTFMEFPTDGFRGSAEVLSAEDFLERRFAGPEGLPDSRSFLRARLVDLLIGDWDRHYGQWRWARFSGEKGLRPIPEDRDQAFSAFDGLAWGATRLVGSQMVELRGRYASTEHMIRNGADHDRLVLSDIEREEWMEIAVGVATAISDEVIGEAVGRLPEEYRDLVANALAARLRERRDRLPEAAADLYDVLHSRADVHGTDRPELVEVERFGNGEVEVRLAVAENGSGAAPYFARRYRPQETEELRIYLGGGADRVRVYGTRSRKIRVRVIAGSGADRVEDQLGDGVVRHDFSDQPRWQVDEQLAARRKGGAFTDTEVRVPGVPLKDWGGASNPLLVFDYHLDHGLVGGGGYDWEIYRFRKLPWSQRHQLRGALATGPPIGFARYDGDFRSRRGSWNTKVSLLGSDMEQLRYYGLGNDTPTDLGGLSARIEETRLQLFVGLERDVGRFGRMSFGPQFRYSDSSESGDRSVLVEERPYGFGTFFEAGLRGEYTFDNRPERPVLEGGLQWRVEATAIPSLGDAESPYGSVEAVGGWHRPLGRPVLLSLFAGGKRVWGDYPFFAAAYLGGHANAVGYRWNRYAGDASLYTSAQLRWRFKKIGGFVPGELGVTALAETGRVSLDGEDSSRWHPGYGIGFFFAPFERLQMIELMVSKGRDDSFVTFNGGVRFAGLK